ncbi:MAG: hypothetical protein JXA43_00310 [Candidatus Diapherotrites archaeon]|nr:hypothetical protein [Candidatus Diapherotrites archaeon]
MGKTQELVAIDFDRLSKSLYRPAPDLSELEFEVKRVESAVGYDLNEVVKKNELESLESVQTTLDFFNLKEEAENLREMILAATGCDSFITTLKSPFGIIDEVPKSIYVTLLGKKDVEEYREITKELAADFFSLEGRDRDYLCVHTLPEYPEVVMWDFTEDLDFKRATRIESEYVENESGGMEHKIKEISLKGPMNGLFCDGRELTTKNVIAGNNKKWMDRFLDLIKAQYPDEAEDIIKEGKEYINHDNSKAWGLQQQILDEAKINYIMDRVARKKELREELRKKHIQWEAEAFIDSFKEELALEKRDEIEADLIEKHITAEKEGKEFCFYCEKPLETDEVLCGWCKKEKSQKNKNCTHHDDTYKVCKTCWTQLSPDSFYESGKWDDITEFANEFAEDRIKEMGGSKKVLRKHQRPDLAEHISND